MNIEYPGKGQEDELLELWRLAFGDSETFIRGFFRTGYDPECCRCVSLEGRIGAALYWFEVQWEDRILAYVYGVATHPAARNRGLCRALMEDTHRVFRQRGYDGALLVPSDAGLSRMYAGMGYQDGCRISQRYCRAGEPAAIRKIGRQEYAALRRKFLPKGGVIQEGRNLAYLETFADFYAGEDFLAAGAGEGKRFHGAELLGNGAAGPGILAALGYEEGLFRVPGKDKPFAMFLPLRDGAGRPEYFGLAFD